METKNAKELGFPGKSCIHPGQIKTVHKIFSPTQEEIDHAKKVMARTLIWHTLETKCAKFEVVCVVNVNISHNYTH